ncbi:MAG: class I SAM-dependent methyltransferase [Gammaproteobacteria bacterium]|nr:class I SAM-dependent methyltransferase [Gammaproteobacteria bacterium]
MIYAVDASKEQLALTKQYLESLNLYNITYIHEAAETLTLHDINIVYSRLLLVHSPCPGTILDRYKTLIAKNGIIVCEEPVVSESFSFPLSEEFEKIYGFIRN